MGDKFVSAVKREYPPGIIGAFALQGALIPGPPKEEFIVFDASMRVPGSPGTKYTAYTEALWNIPMSTGRRTAKEIKHAHKIDRMHDIVT